MNPIVGSESLKLHFSTLFLSTSFLEVKIIIDEAKFSYVGQSCYFYSILYKLDDVLEKIEKRKDELIHLSSGQFLRKFNDHLLQCGMLMIPSVAGDACMRFFPECL